MLEKIKNFYLNNKVAVLTGGTVLAVGVSVFIVVNLKKANVDTNLSDDNKVVNNVEKDKNNGANKEENINIDEKDNIIDVVISDKIPSIEGFKKSFYEDDNYIEEDYKLDTSHVKIGDTTKSSKELINKYKLTLNGVSKELVASYTLDKKSIRYKLTLGGKVVIEDFKFRNLDNVESIDDIDEYEIFDPKKLTFFKGEDGREYMFLELVTQSTGLYRVEGIILNSDGNILSVNIGGEDKSTFLIHESLGFYVNMSEYSKEFGYKSKRYSDDEISKTFLVIKDNKIRYLSVLNTEECKKNYDAVEYELTVKDNLVSAKKIATYEVYWVTQNVC